MLVNQDDALKPHDLRIIKYLEGHPSKITYRPLKPDGNPVDTDIELDDAIILGPTYHGTGIRVKASDGTTKVIARDHLVKIEQPKVAGGHGKHIYFGEEKPIQGFGRAGDIYVTPSGVLEKKQAWEDVFEMGGGSTGGAGTEGTSDTL